MYRYNLIIKAGRIEDMDALVQRQLFTRFGEDVLYVTHAKLTNEAVIIVYGESKRSMQTTLDGWFAEDARKVGTFRPGTLLHYRELTDSNGPLSYGAA